MSPDRQTIRALTLTTFCSYHKHKYHSCNRKYHIYKYIFFKQITEHHRQTTCVCVCAVCVVVGQRNIAHIYTNKWNRQPILNNTPNIIAQENTTRLLRRVYYSRAIGGTTRARRPSNSINIHQPTKPTPPKKNNNTNEITLAAIRFVRIRGLSRYMIWCAHREFNI